MPDYHVYGKGFHVILNGWDLKKIAIQEVTWKSREYKSRGDAAGYTAATADLKRLWTVDDADVDNMRQILRGYGLRIGGAVR